MEQKNSGKWDRNFIVAVIAIFVAIATPELRKLFRLEKSAPQRQTEQRHVEKPKPPSGPFSATLHESQPQFIEEAETGLSVIFNEEYNIVTLTIAPDGRQSSNHAVLNGYSEEFTSSAGARIFQPC